MPTRRHSHDTSYSYDDITDEESGFDELHDSEAVKRCAYCKCLVYTILGGGGYVRMQHAYYHRSCWDKYIEETRIRGDKIHGTT